MGKIHSSYRILSSLYGTPKRVKHDPIETLVLTILSQNTSDVNRDRAYTNMRRSFRDWDSIVISKQKKLENTIKEGGLARVKARYIKNSLKAIKHQTGAYTLDFLEPLPLEQARNYLLSLDGVGPKTAAVVLSFSFGKPAFPVDTHVFRVSKRLGLIPEMATVETAQKILEKKIPKKWIYAFHLNMIKHGRQICSAKRPNCQKCRLIAICNYKHKTKTTQKKTQEI